MEAQSIKEYEQLEKYYWWFVGRRRIIEKVLEKNFSGRKLNILDWGCGPGGNFKFLSKHGDVVGVDVSDEAISSCKEKGINSVVKANSLNEFNPNVSFDLVTNFDVLEHISEDEQFLRDVKRLLKPDGHILLTVPAYQFLWSELDKVSGHKRRYTRKEICRRLNLCGYEVVMSSYFIFFLSPAFIGYRIFQNLRKTKSSSLIDSVVEFPRVINFLFTKLLFLEALILPNISLPFGTSIVVLAKKQP